VRVYGGVWSPDRDVQGLVEARPLSRQADWRLAGCFGSQGRKARMAEPMKRYDLVPDGPDSVYPVEERDGEWVRFQDLIPLMASVGLLAMERDELERKVRELQEKGS